MSDFTTTAATATGTANANMTRRLHRQKVLAATPAQHE